MDEPMIYESSDAVVSVQKRRLKPYKQLIKQYTPRTQRFSSVRIDLIPQLNKYCSYVHSNGFNYSIDNKINKLSQKLCPDLYNGCHTSDTKTSKKRKYDDMIDLFAVNDDNEELDFEEEDNYKSLKTNNDNYKSKSRQETNQTNGSTNSDNRNKCSTSDNHKNDIQKKPYQYIPGFKNGFNGEMNGFANTKSFKIPKKDSQNIETIMDRTDSLMTSRLWAEAYENMSRYLSDEHFKRDDVIKQMIEIAKGLVTNNDLRGNNINNLNALVDKLKCINYIDDDFWDQIIYAIVKKSDHKTNTQINMFLSGLYDYLLDNKISARVVCTEAVIIAFRIQTKHPTAKDLVDLYNTPSLLVC